jgi:hypothetical protein
MSGYRLDRKDEYQDINGLIAGYTWINNWIYMDKWLDING